MVIKKLPVIFLLIYLRCRCVTASSKLEEIFENNGCIQASLLSIPTKHGQTTSLMLDKDSSASSTASSETTTEGSLINLTSIINDPNLNFDKSSTELIHELAQYNKIDLKYSLIDETGPPHNRRFKVKLVLEDDQHFETFSGEGASIKIAKQEAALIALKDTFFKIPPHKDKERQVQTPTVILANVGAKLGIPILYSNHKPTRNKELNIDNKFKWTPINSSNSSELELETVSLAVEESQDGGPFWMKVTVEDREFIGKGLTRQEAKHDAALKALEQLRKDALVLNNVCLKEDSSDLCKERKESLKNPISRLHEASVRMNSLLNFEIIDENGPPHQRVFVTRCKFGEYVTDGEGRSKQKSKAAAADKMWAIIKDESSSKDNTISENEIVNGLSGKKKKKKKSAILREFEQLDNYASNKLPHKVDDNNYNENRGETDSDTSPKHLLLKITDLLNLKVSFIDLVKFQTNFYSLLSLGINPDQICLGKAPTRDKAMDWASLNGLKSLKKLGLLDHLDHSKISKEDQMLFLQILEHDDDYGATILSFREDLSQKE